MRRSSAFSLARPRAEWRVQDAAACPHRSRAEKAGYLMPADLEFGRVLEPWSARVRVDTAVGFLPWAWPLPLIAERLSFASIEATLRRVLRVQSFPANTVWMRWAQEVAAELAASGAWLDLVWVNLGRTLNSSRYSRTFEGRFSGTLRLVSILDQVYVTPHQIAGIAVNPTGCPLPSRWEHLRWWQQSLGGNPYRVGSRNHQHWSQNYGSFSFGWVSQAYKWIRYLEWMLPATLLTELVDDCAAIMLFQQVQARRSVSYPARRNREPRGDPWETVDRDRLNQAARRVHFTMGEWEPAFQGQRGAPPRELSPAVLPGLDEATPPQVAPPDPRLHRRLRLREEE